MTPAVITPVALESLTGLRSPQPPAAVAAAATNPVQAVSDLSMAFSHLSSSSSSLDPCDDNGMSGRGRLTSLMFFPLPLPSLKVNGLWLVL